MDVTIQIEKTNMTDIKPKQTGQRIKQYRLKAGLSQGGLAKKAGMNTNAYAKIERGESEPTSATLTKLAKALNLVVSDLLGA